MGYKKNIYSGFVQPDPIGGSQIHRMSANDKILDIHPLSSESSTIQYDSKELKLTGYTRTLFRHVSYFAVSIFYFAVKIDLLTLLLHVLCSLLLLCLVLSLVLKL